MTRSAAFWSFCSDKETPQQSWSNSPLHCNLLSWIQAQSSRHLSLSMHDIKHDKHFFGVLTCLVPPVWQRPKGHPKWHSAACQAPCKSRGGCCSYLHLWLLIYFVKRHGWNVAVSLRCSCPSELMEPAERGAALSACQEWQQAILDPFFSVSHPGLVSVIFGALFSDWLRRRWL